MEIFSYWKSAGSSIIHKSAVVEGEEQSSVHLKVPVIKRSGDRTQISRTTDV